MNRVLVPLFAAITAVSTLNAAANSASVIDELTIIGSKKDVRKVAGSGAVIGDAQIAMEVSTDINQLLKTVPGVYVREEDGYGLRPNFGIRGATSERSEKVTLMEDGVLIAPAPYSNPAAYYFPTTMRIKGVEVLKGAPLLRYGPQTVGGVINMITTAIPESNAGSLTLAAIENNGVDLLASYGGRSGAVGWLVETAQRENEGFKNIDRSGRDSGYDIEDYMGKLAWQGESQSILFKAQRSQETSNETYLGLTDADFDRNEDRRYGLSSIDEMNNKHEGYNLSHKLNINDTMALTTTAYYNEFERDWFKLSGGGSLIAAANGGDEIAQGILDGNVDTDGLKYKHNNRSYLSKGLQSELALNINSHSIHVGVRVHRDDMDRFQPQERYQQIGGSLVYTSTDSVTGSNNRLETAEATSVWLVDSWQASDKLALNTALRYEDVETSRRQYSTQNRSDTPSLRSNNTQEWLPGLSATYQLNGNWQVLAGVHKGFSPLGGGAKTEEEPESSVNYEAGLRYDNDQWFVEAIGFWSDFENKAENCSNGNPCSNGKTSGSYVTGDAVIAGLEFQFSNSFLIGSMTVPVDVAYTYTQAEVSEDNTNEGIVDGDKLANIPEHTFSLRSGIETAMGWDNYVSIKYIDETCNAIGCAGNFVDTDAFVSADLISHYALNESVTVFLKVENVLDKRAIVSRSPDGARPNKGRMASVGFSMDF
ncbi:MAG: Fe(3+) dicitrate transport protein FecA [SAR92 bacterium MED-G29]|jgi:Fe(3+) dicitrate transport protein|nr:MAG: Fe(3+) dicitrate transport protein FecA [SAR92 bacterium MED-G29]